MARQTVLSGMGCFDGSVSPPEPKERGGLEIKLISRPELAHYVVGRQEFVAGDVVDIHHRAGTVF